MSIHIHDSTEFDPEVIAMLQAFYSRSDLGIEQRIHDLMQEGTGTSKEDKIRSAMRTYYVGYGHKSIGDMGNTVVFAEDVSMLCAKGVQDSPLYNGQECSTRYLDFRDREIRLPGADKEGIELVDEFMSTYRRLMPKVVDGIAKEYPRGSESSSVWEKAVQARAFDVLRCLIPNGMTTRLSWSTALSHANEHLVQLYNSPFSEMRQVATDIHQKLIDRYPNSFRADLLHSERSKTRESADFIEGRNEYVGKFGHYPEQVTHYEKVVGAVRYTGAGVDKHGIDGHSEALRSRPRGVPLPRWFAYFGNYKVSYSLDFGSYRDVQRHRNLVNLPPLIKKFEFSQWYTDQIKRFSGKDIAPLLEKAHDYFTRMILATQTGNSPLSIYDLQYYFPMGTIVNVTQSLGLPELVYIAELRSNKSVHPTLRYIAQDFANIIKRNHPCAALYVDYDEDWWDVKRGEQTIVRKE
jgi:thymidylate synthase ThyX